MPGFYKKESTIPTRSFQTPPPPPATDERGTETEAEIGEFQEEFYAQFRYRLRQVVRELLEQTMQAELDLFLAAQNGERGAVGRRGYRNGYYERDLVTTEGKIADLRVPRDREGEFQTQAFARYARYQPEIVEGAKQMFVSGVSQSRVGAVLEKLTGSPLSQSAVSRISRSIEAQVAEWLERPLAAEYKIAYLDAVYFPIRHGERVDQTALLVALGVGLDGHKEVLGMLCGAEESKDCWLTLLRNLRKRGVEKVELVVTDGGGGLLAALPVVFPDAKRQRCVTHKMRNVLSHTPARKKKEIGETLSALFKAPDRAAAQAQYEAFCVRYEQSLPAAVKSLRDDWEACLTFYDFESGLQRYIKTTNALESLFSQVRQRTNSMKIFQDEGSCLMIVGASMQQVKFQRIPV